MIRLGTIQTKKMLLGTTTISKAYLGGALVWTKSSGPATEYMKKVTQIDFVLPQGGDTMIYLPIDAAIDWTKSWIVTNGQTTNSGAGSYHRDLLIYPFTTAGYMVIQRRGNAVAVSGSFMIMEATAALVVKCQQIQPYFNSGASAQTGTVSLTNWQNAVVFHNGTWNDSDNTASNFSNAGASNAILTSNTNVDIERGGTAGDNYLALSIVEFQPAVLVGIKRWKTTFTGTTSPQVVTYGGPDLINLDNCMYVDAGWSCTAATTTIYNSQVASPTVNASNVSYARQGNGNITIKRAGQVVEFVSGVLKSAAHRAEYSFASGTGDVDYDLPRAFDRTKTILSVIGRRTAVTSSVSTWWPYLRWTDDDTIKITRNSTPGNGVNMLGVQAIEFN